jgi:hypothetical protein
MKKAYILINASVSKDATDFYLEVIKKALIFKGFGTEVGCDIYMAVKSDVVVTVDAKDSFKVFFISKMILRNPKVISWFQGVVPEEAYYVFKSRIRQRLWEVFEIFSFIVSNHYIFVSRAMCKHYRDKYFFLNFGARKYTVIPCINKSRLNPELFGIKKSLSFVYAGSLAEWQKFSYICDIYKKIENRCLDASFLVLTSDVCGAELILNEKEISNYNVKYVPYEDVDSELIKCKYGFVIRDDHVVNRVATPTKISGYLANGVVPILSKYVGDFFSIWEGNREVIFTDNNLDTLVDSILFHHEHIEWDSLSFLKYFQNDFNEDAFVKSLIEGIKID